MSRSGEKKQTIASFSCLFFLFFFFLLAAPSHIKLSFCHAQESMLARICAVCGDWCAPQAKLKGHRGKHQYTQQDALQTCDGGRTVVCAPCGAAHLNAALIATKTAATHIHLD